MGLFSSLIKTTLDTVTSPLDIAKDIVTLGGTLTDDESAILEKAEKLLEDVEEVSDELI